MTAILKGIIRFYRYWISPLLGRSCRYHPTCSAYALEALDQHGPLRGSWLALRRVLSCHAWSRRPFHDPVPHAITPKTTQKTQSSKEAE